MKAEHPVSVTKKKKQYFYLFLDRAFTLVLRTPFFCVSDWVCK